MNINREVELLNKMGFDVTAATLQAEKDKHAARVAEDLKHREAEEIAEVVAWVGEFTQFEEGGLVNTAPPVSNLEIDEIERDWKQQVDELRGGV